jgi:nitroreductase
MSNHLDPKLDFIFSRRSIRAFAPGEISEETEHKLLQSAMAAPSAVAKDPWRFVVVRHRQTLLRITEALPNGQMLPTAALGIVVCGDLEAAHDRQISYLLQDCSAAIENLLLGARALGLGTCWLGVHPREQRMQTLKQILGLPGSIIPVAVVAVGLAAEKKDSRSRFNPDYVHHDRW